MSSNTNRFTEKSHEALVAAQTLAERNGNSQVEPEHVLLALLDHAGGAAQRILQQAGLKWIRPVTVTA